ncbi:MAG: N-6 DNA methylase [Lachnospiraceae bacterium]|nr:N-6 DNA methylase [Lachnospiraceae bacterium]
MIKKIIKEIIDMSGNYSGYDIFTDWIKATAIAMSNQSDIFRGEIWRKREQDYMDIVRKHGKDNILRFANMTGMLAVALEDDMEDVLGRIYMEAGFGSKHTGQFFTPFHVSKLTADIALELNQRANNGKIELSEPSVGGGGMIIAAARTLKERGVRYQKVLSVTAQDLDWKGVYMSYVQFGLLGIDATVIQGDTLSGDRPGPEYIYYTPARKEMLL